MSVRASFVAVAVVVGTVFVVGCSQMTAPTAVTSSGSASSSAPSSLIVTSLSMNTLQPILAQLGRVQNFFDSANHQLNLVAIPGDPCIPTDPCFGNHLDSAFDFYMKANGVLDALVPRVTPIPVDPCLPTFMDAVGGIIQRANNTQDLLENIPAGPVTEAISFQVSHTLSVVNGPLACSP